MGELERERAAALEIEPATARGESIYQPDFRAGTFRPVECRIQLDVAAFLSAESVARVYAAARRLAWAQRLIGGRIPTPGRALSAKMIKLAVVRRAGAQEATVGLVGPATRALGPLLPGVGLW